MYPRLTTNSAPPARDASSANSRSLDTAKAKEQGFRRMKRDEQKAHAQYHKAAVVSYVRQHVTIMPCQQQRRRQTFVCTAILLLSLPVTLGYANVLTRDKNSNLRGASRRRSDDETTSIQRGLYGDTRGDGVLDFRFVHRHSSVMVPSDATFSTVGSMMIFDTPIETDFARVGGNLEVSGRLTGTCVRLWASSDMLVGPFHCSFIEELVFSGGQKGTVAFEGTIDDFHSADSPVMVVGTGQDLASYKGLGGASISHTVLDEYFELKFYLHLEVGEEEVIVPDFAGANYAESPLDGIDSAAP